jgi:hypothetical protein
MRALASTKTVDAKVAHRFTCSRGAEGSAPIFSPVASSPLFLQRKASCACGGGCPACQAKSSELKVSQPNDPAEIEADRIADRVMRMADSDTASAARTSHPLNAIHRQCDACEDEEQTIQRKSLPSGGGIPAQSPAHVQGVMSSGGQPLDHAIRSFFEPKFGYDLRAVRIHTGERAEASAREIDAKAYTLGSHIVFGSGEYQPESERGRRLLAHELAHTVQQGGAPRQLQRACLPVADCAAPRATLTTFVEDTEKKPENISKADKRQKACTPVRTAACTSDGHGAKATALTSLLNTHYKSRLGHVTGVFVHKDMPADWGAVTQECSTFMPPLPGGKCTFVPDVLEAQTKLFQGGSKSVGGKPRDTWLTDTLGTLTHETEHARFDTAAPIAQPNAAACKFEDHESNLSEMAAHLSEMHVYYREALTKTGPSRFKRFEDMFAFWVTNGSEDIAGIVKDLRCHCECADADYYITKTAESVSTSQKWDTNEAFTIHSELSAPKWKLNWPVKPAGIGVVITDLPGPAAVPFTLE